MIRYAIFDIDIDEDGTCRLSVPMMTHYDERHRIFDEYYTSVEGAARAIEEARNNRSVVGAHGDKVIVPIV